MKILIICLCAWAIAQLIKVALTLMRDKRFDWRIFFGTGGMPSSHSATVCALAVSLGMTYGINSPYFSIALILALIVMYDAAGVRRAVSRMSTILNRIMRELREQRPRDEVERDLRELWGHSPFQVLVGALIGCLVGWLGIIITR